MKKEPEPEGFMDLWTLWRPHCRHTDGRGRARITYAKFISMGVDPMDILDGARYFLRTLVDKKFIPLAASWLNSERWADDCEKEREYRARQADIQVSNVIPMPGPRGQTAYLKSLKQSESA